jgi:sensor c-di-GMP phosphodiesterase-like protein
MSTVPVRAIDNSAWIRDLVYLAFPEGEARERVLFDLVKQFSKMDPEDPEWLRYKLNVVECRAMENMARALNEAAKEQAKLRGVTREMADFASTQIRGTIENAASQTRQMLEDVQLSLHDAISGEAILKSYTGETRQQFAAVIKEIIEDTLVRALTLSQQRMDEWMKGTLDNSIRDAQKSLAAVTTNFRVKLGGAWGQLLWGCIGGGVLAGVLLLMGGFWLGRNW